MKFHEPIDFCLLWDSQIVVKANMCFQFGVDPILEHYRIHFISSNRPKKGQERSHDIFVIDQRFRFLIFSVFQKCKGQMFEEMIYQVTNDPISIRWTFFSENYFWNHLGRAYSSSWSCFTIRKKRKTASDVTFMYSNSLFLQLLLSSWNDSSFSIALSILPEVSGKDLRRIKGHSKCKGINPQN